MFQDQYASVQVKKNQSQAWFEAEQFIIIIIEEKLFNCRSTVTAVEANFASAEALHFASFWALTDQ